MRDAFTCMLIDGRGQEARSFSIVQVLGAAAVVVGIRGRSSQFSEIAVIILV